MMSVSSMTTTSGRNWTSSMNRAIEAIGLNRLKGAVPRSQREGARLKRMNETSSRPPCCTPGTWAYTTRHRYVVKARGPASARSCEMCGRPAEHWATVPEQDDRPHVHDVHAGYRSLCRGCHKAYDTWYGADDADATALDSTRPRRTPTTDRAQQTLTDAAVIARFFARGELVPNYELMPALQAFWPERYAGRSHTSIGADLRIIPGRSLQWREGDRMVKGRLSDDIINAADALRHEQDGGVK